MANTCSTQYVIWGPVDKIKELKQALDNIAARKSYPELSDLMTEIGADPNILNRNGVIFRPQILSHNHRITFTVDTGWVRCDNLEGILEDVFDGIAIWYLEEELGCDIFCTNDQNHEIIKDYIIIDTDDDGMEYFNERHARARLKKLLGKTPEAQGVDFANDPLEKLEDFVFENYDDIRLHVAEVA